MDCGQYPVPRDDVAAAESAVGNTPEHKQRADGHQVHQVPKRCEQRNDGCAHGKHTIGKQFCAFSLAF